jgi:hypothetical protein
MDLEINGVKYVKVEKEPRKQMSSSVAKVIMLASMFGVFGGKTKQVDINIIEEFELIQQKKSKLSSKDRDWVNYKFNKEYKKV